METRSSKRIVAILDARRERMLAQHEVVPAIKESHFASEKIYLEDAQRYETDVSIQPAQQPMRLPADFVSRLEHLLTKHK